MLHPLLLLLPALGAPGAAPAPEAAPAVLAQVEGVHGPAADDGNATPIPAVAPPPPLMLERGPGLAPMHAPRGEELTYKVHVDVAMLEAAVGTVTLTSGVEPYRTAILGDDPEETEAGERPETAVFRCHAKGDYTLYTIDATIESRVLPQEWPRIQYRYTHSGTENRRREIQIGTRDGEGVSRYRRDTSKGAPKGRRIWKPAEERAVPEGTVDMLTAAYLARELVQRDLSSLSFPLLDKDRLWLLTISRGAEKRIQTPAGIFDAVEIVMKPEPYPGEKVEAKDVERFEGLFGIRGSIHLWLQRDSGVPIRVQGDLPVGPITLGIDVVLQEAKGTPAAFVADARQ